MADRMLAEFDDEAAIIAAIRRLHDQGHRRLEVYMPFPSHEVEEVLAEAIGAHRSRLPFAIFVFGIGGAGFAYFLQWLLVGFLYPLDAGGRPPHFPLAFVIITFEMGVLAASLCAFFGALILGRLVRLTDDVQGTPGFESATRDRFWLEVRARGAAGEPERARQALRQALIDTGALRVEIPEVPS
jgi:Protein of unknown function (DUF3341)